MKSKYAAQSLFLACISLLLFSAIVCAFLYSFWHVQFLNTTYSAGQGNAPIAFSMPLYIPSAEPDMLATIHFSVPIQTTWFHRFYRIIPDDCLQSLRINGTAVEKDVPICPPYLGGRVYDLSDYLHTGINDFEIGIKNNFGDLSLQMYPEFLGAFPYLVTSIALLILAIWIGYFTR